jgi:Predicted membrane protein (DUF2232)
MAGEPRPPGRWRLLLATAAFVVWAPPSFAGLPLAALLLAARPAGARERRWAALIGVPSLFLLAASSGDLLGGLAHMYAILFTAAFLALALVAPTRFFPQAVRASLLALAGGLVLARVVLGSDAAAMVRWASTRRVTETLAVLVHLRPELFTVFEPAARFVTATVPATLVLQAIAGLALAWRWHERLAAHPLGAPLAPFREFRFADAWVWGVVAGAAVWITPVLAGLKAAALNLLVVLGALYLLRGLAITIAFAAVAGIPPTALALGFALSAVLALPLFFLVPGLATLGITDTWLEFRRRLARGPHPR